MCHSARQLEGVIPSNNLQDINIQPAGKANLTVRVACGHQRFNAG